MAQEAVLAQTSSASQLAVLMASPDTQQAWPKLAHTAGNAGVMVVGWSARHGSVPAVLLGGRYYTGKKTYCYTDFGGGVERTKGETPQQGACREFVEELLALEGHEAKAAADGLCNAIPPALVGGRPFVHKAAYVMFLVPAETIVRALQLPEVAEGASAIDQLLALAKLNSELTSVALVGVEDLLLGASCDGRVRPLAVRQLDGEERSSSQIWLRALMVGASGSIRTISDTLEVFADQPPPPPPAAAPQTHLDPVERHATAKVGATRSSSAASPAAAEVGAAREEATAGPALPVRSEACATPPRAREGRQQPRDALGEPGGARGARARQRRWDRSGARASA
uniref:Nudix hydrolase domain-containing protein n=1 Tax=Alexandrium monilatum TaxID=311494 RepID=A0A7S4T7F3_9DINO